eukprot:TRINITY_DN9670_c0_g1_i1.p1 TRINITY_DN9670_c0_g1~~TRINITY_DN9670_c0_g1_i1.p1  ORF type:complete len:799 (-),score=96.49 TRINITY_DN9670_c0_g1_i1:535-2931(-)
MRPAPSTKPQVLIALVEPSEDVRLQIGELFQTIIACNDSFVLRAHVDEIVSGLRALTMDPCLEVQVQGCKLISEFARSFKELLFHFTETVARSLLLPLVHPRSKVRLAALEALGQVLYCGQYKYTAGVMELLTAYRDPNLVPIRDFYEPSTALNYLAMLISDSKEIVRETFLRTVSDWLNNLPDRADVEPRLAPYLLSGLFDPSGEIQEFCFEAIEEIGQLVEKEKEKEFRERKQFGVDADWTAGGRLVNLPLPLPFIRRPRLGARVFVRNHVRRFFKPLYAELRDWRQTSRAKAANLLLVSVVYTEELMTQHLDAFILGSISAFHAPEKDDAPILATLRVTYKLIGRFCEARSFLPIVASCARGELVQHEFAFLCAIRALTCLIAGQFEAVVEGVGIGASKVNFAKDVIDLLGQPHILEAFDRNTANEGIALLNELLSGIRSKAIPSEFSDIISSRAGALTRTTWAILSHGYYDHSFVLGAEKVTNLHSSTKAFFSGLPKSFSVVSELGVSPVEVNESFVPVDSGFRALATEMLYHTLVIVMPERVDSALATFTRIPEEALTTTARNVLLRLAVTILQEFEAEKSLPPQCLPSLLRLVARISLSEVSAPHKKEQDILRLEHEAFEFLTHVKQFLGLARGELLTNDFTLFLKLVMAQSRFMPFRRLKSILELLQATISSTNWDSSASALVHIAQYAVGTFAERYAEAKEIGGALIGVLGAAIHAVPTSERSKWLSSQAKPVLSEIVRLALDEKDPELRQELCDLLSELKRTTPEPFIAEMARAQSNGQLAKEEFLAKI